jgi:ATP-dependent DNA ligase
MLAEPTPLAHLRPSKHAFELKWDGIRAIVGLNGELQVRSRRGWNMTNLLPELAAMPTEGVFDGELVAFNEGLVRPSPALAAIHDPASPRPARPDGEALGEPVELLIRVGHLEGNVGRG